MVKLFSFEVVAGTYEEFLLGYSYSSKRNELVQSFAAHDHSASIRCTASSGQYLASGGADDRIFIYDLKTRKEHCSLTHNNATITCLAFTPNHTHLISGTSDGVLSIVRVGNWQLEKNWENAHKGSGILDIAVHASGKLALSLGADGTLCTWNLVKGRQAYVINLKTKSKDARTLEHILWAPDEVRFILYGGKYTEIWSIESGGILQHQEHKQKVTSCLWLDDNQVVTGHEDGHLSVFSIEDGDTKLIKAHESRIKACSVYKKRIITVASGGDIKIWNKHLEELTKIDTGCRITSLCVVPALQLKEEPDSGIDIREKDTENINLPEEIPEPTNDELPPKKKKKQKIKIP